MRLSSTFPGTFMVKIKIFYDHNWWIRRLPNALWSFISSRKILNSDFISVKKFPGFFQEFPKPGNLFYHFPGFQGFPGCVETLGGRLLQSQKVTESLCFHRLIFSRYILACKVRENHKKVFRLDTNKTNIKLVIIFIL